MFGRFHEIPGDSPMMERVSVSEDIPRIMPFPDDIVTPEEEAINEFIKNIPDDIDVAEEKQVISEMTSEEREYAHLGEGQPAIKLIRSPREIDKKLAAKSKNPERILARLSEGMLCPFRSYKFQVCNLSGESDNGSSQIKDLPDICRRYPDEEACRLMSIEAKAAAERFGTVIDEDNPIWRKFILDSVVYMRTRKFGGMPI